MTHVQEFDNFEDAMRAMREAEEAANANTLEKQRGIGYGDLWCRPVPEYGIFVFGRVMTEQEAAKGEHPDTVASLRDAHARGYRYGLAYSVLEPTGEYGSTHVANMWPISEEDFNQAQDHGWTPTMEFVERIFAEAAEEKRLEGKASSVDEPAQMEDVDNGEDTEG